MKIDVKWILYFGSIVFIIMYMQKNGIDISVPRCTFRNSSTIQPFQYSAPTPVIVKEVPVAVPVDVEASKQNELKKLDQQKKMIDYKIDRYKAMAFTAKPYDGSGGPNFGGTWG